MSADFQAYFPGKVGRHLTKAFLRKIARSPVPIFLPACNSNNLFPNRQQNEKLMVVQTILMQGALGPIQLHRTHKYKVKEHTNKTFKEQDKIIHDKKILKNSAETCRMYGKGQF